MKLTKRELKRLIKETMEEEFGEETEFGAPTEESSNVKFLDRQAWKAAKGMRAGETTEEDLDALRQALPDKNIVDPSDINQIRRATQDASERDVIALGKVGEEIWFKLGAPDSADNQYGKLASAQSETGSELGVLDTKPNLGGHL